MANRSGHITGVVELPTASRAVRGYPVSPAPVSPESGWQSGRHDGAADASSAWLHAVQPGARRTVCGLDTYRFLPARNGWQRATGTGTKPCPSCTAAAPAGRGPGPWLPAWLRPPGYRESWWGWWMPAGSSLAFILFIVGIAGGCIIGWAGAGATPTAPDLAIGLSALTATGAVLVVRLALPEGVTIGPRGVAVARFGGAKTVPWSKVGSFKVGWEGQRVVVISDTGVETPLGFARPTEEQAQLFAANVNAALGLAGGPRAPMAPAIAGEPESADWPAFRLGPTFLTEPADQGELAGVDYYRAARELVRPIVVGDRVSVHSQMPGKNPFGTITKLLPNDRAMVRRDWSGHEHSFRISSLSLTNKQDNNPVKPRGWLVTAVRWYLNLPGGG